MFIVCINIHIHNADIHKAEQYAGEVSEQRIVLSQWTVILEIFYIFSYKLYKLYVISSTRGVERSLLKIK